ncbi:MAG TPA: hypothetical protein VEG84_05440, partial [Thermoanaerobaculia bacterium]|nr:hypothetical protein [Thermoanaerobaculia bacterium]
MILAALLFLAAPPVPAAASSSRTLTSVGRDLVVATPVDGRVLAALANVRIEARVSGDVVVWGGDVSFGPGGSVGGNLSVFLGALRSEGAPPVAGVVSTPGSLLRLYLAEMRRAPWETPGSGVVWGLRLLGLALWLGVTMALLYVFGSPFARAAAQAEASLPISALAGALTVLTLLLAAAALLALLPSSLSVPAALAVGAVAVAAKIFGMGALFLLLGQKLLGAFSARR